MSEFNGTYTPNLNLTKDDPNDDYYSVERVNENNNKIDEFAGKTITKDKLINNLTATEEGYALDARQGKIIGDELNNINGTLEEHSTQLLGMANQSDLNTTNTNVSNHLADLMTDSDGVHGLKIESGTWTPIIIGSTTAGSNTYSVNSGKYHKSGKMIIASFDVGLTAKDTAMVGNISVGGLPYVGQNISNYVATGLIGYYNNITGMSGSGIGLQIGQNGTSISLSQFIANTVASLTQSNITAMTRIQGQITYLTN